MDAPNNNNGEDATEEDPKDVRGNEEVDRIDPDNNNNNKKEEKKVKMALESEDDENEMSTAPSTRNLSAGAALLEEASPYLRLIQQRSSRESFDQATTSNNNVTPSGSFSEIPTTQTGEGLSSVVQPRSPYHRDPALSPRPQQQGGGLLIRSSSTNLSSPVSPTSSSNRSSLLFRRKSSRVGVLSPSAAAASTTIGSGSGVPPFMLPSPESMDIGGTGTSKTDDVKNGTTTPAESGTSEHDYPLITLLCYRGYEVVFATTTEYLPSSSSTDNGGAGGGAAPQKMVRHDGVQILHARTRLPAFVSLLNEENHHTNHQTSTTTSAMSSIDHPSLTSSDSTRHRQGFIPIPPEIAGHIVALEGNNTTGKVVLLTSRGLVILLVPKPCSVKRYTHGKYVWNIKCVWNVTELFVNPASPPRGTATPALFRPGDVGCLFQRRSPQDDVAAAALNHNDTEMTNQIVSVCLSLDDRLLLALGDQLAVLDLSHQHHGAGGRNNHKMTTYSNAFQNIQSVNRFIAWTKKLSSSLSPPPVVVGNSTTGCSTPTTTIVQADMSGDGGVIACIMATTNNATATHEQQEQQQQPQEQQRYGVYTFIHDGTSDEENVVAAITGGISNISTKGSAEVTAAGMSSSGMSQRLKLRRSKSIGIIYRPGVFLTHATPVTSIQWRHKGLTMSSCNPIEHNDFLMTHCSEDSSFRVFSQSQIENHPTLVSTSTSSSGNKGTTASISTTNNHVVPPQPQTQTPLLPLVSPAPILHWMAPPYSVATWVDGISLMNLGDLTDIKTGAISNEDIAMGSAEAIQKASASTYGQQPTATLMQNHTTTRVMQQQTSKAGGGPTSSVAGAGTAGTGGGGVPVVPTTAAGAWICELTFRGNFPALRLSRLSFVRNANKAARDSTTEGSGSGGGGIGGGNPAHFESVAVLLPPGILPGLDNYANPKKSLPPLKHILRNVLQISVQGIWSAWDMPPPTSSSSSSSNSYSYHHHNEHKWMGGSHAPPSELRLVASHASWGRNRITLLNFPLWGESDLGINIEFGTPIRYALSLLPLQESDSYETSTGTTITGTSTADANSITTSKELSKLAGSSTNSMKQIQLSNKRCAVWRMPTGGTLLARVVLVPYQQQQPSQESAPYMNSFIRLEYRQEASLALLPMCHAVYHRNDKTSTATTTLASSMVPPTTATEGNGFLALTGTTSMDSTTVAGGENDDEMNSICSDLSGDAYMEWDVDDSDGADDDGKNNNSRPSSLEPLKRYMDVSPSPLPILLPSLYPYGPKTSSSGRNPPSSQQQPQQRSKQSRQLSSSSSSPTTTKEIMVAVHWWPKVTCRSPYPGGGESTSAEESYVLLALTNHGRLVIYEIPPPYAATEPAMPTSYDPIGGGDETPEEHNSNVAGSSSIGGGSHLNSVGTGTGAIGAATSSSSVQGGIGGASSTGGIIGTSSFGGGGAGGGGSATGTGATSQFQRCEYEVNITPHPDFGIGLRLESRALSSPNDEVAIAGSFKKHPLSGSRLPAEKSGLIVIGDVLVGVNGVDLLYKTFDEVIDTVRYQSSVVARNKCPLKLKFKPFDQLYLRTTATVDGSSSVASGRRPRRSSVTPGGANDGGGSVGGRSTRSHQSSSGRKMGHQAFQPPPHVPDNVVVPTPTNKGGATTTTTTGTTAPTPTGNRRTIDEILGIPNSMSREDLKSATHSRTSSQNIVLDSIGDVNDDDDDDELIGVLHASATGTSEDDDDDNESGATVQVGAEAETQQEFGRVIGVSYLYDSYGSVLSSSSSSFSNSKIIGCSTILPFQNSNNTVSANSNNINSKASDDAASPSSLSSSCALMYSIEDHVVAVQVAMSDIETVLPEENVSCQFLQSYSITTAVVDENGEEERKKKQNTSSSVGEKTIVAMETVHYPVGTSKGCVAVLDNIGTVFLVVLEQDSEKQNAFQFQSSMACRCLSDDVSNNKVLSSIQFRASSIELFATLSHLRVDDDSSQSHEIKVWKAWPILTTETKQKGQGTNDTSLVTKSTNATAKTMSSDESLYQSFDVTLPSPLGQGEIVRSIDWMASPSPTALNTGPLLLVWTTVRVIVYRFEYDRWYDIFDVRFSNHLLSSKNAATATVTTTDPSHLYPHILKGLHALSSVNSQNNTTSKVNDSTNEVKTILRDSSGASTSGELIPEWHPDSVLASICCDPKGVQHSMRKRKDGMPNGSFASSVIHWLAEWTNPDESERPMLGNHIWYSNTDASTSCDKHGQHYESNPGMGNVVPFALLLSNKANVTSGKEDGRDDDDEEEAPVENADNLMLLLSRAPPGSNTAGQTPENSRETLSEKDMLLQELAELVEKFVFLHEQLSKGKKKKKKEIVTLAKKGVSSTEEEDEEEKIVLPTLPKPLGMCSIEELICLRGMIELYRNPPSFTALDKPGQLALFSVELSRIVAETYDDTEEAKARRKKKEDAKAKQTSIVNPLDGEAKRSSTACAFSNPSVEDDVVSHPIPSSAALMALVSGTQIDLLSRCKKGFTLPNQKMDLATSRRLMIPFWLRDMDTLKRVSEEIALNIFKETRDVMECALLFVAMRKIPMLTNLARTDDSLSGKTFMKFLINHNFSSPKGRNAAEKNAYSLLRKRRYGVAAAFFLLAEPPLMSTALEVIINNMEDPQLALLVSRLIDDARSGVSGPGGLNLAKLGGGGGFASVGGQVPDDTPEEEPFEKWKPTLSDIARQKIKLGAIPKAVMKKDFAMAAMLHLWIGDDTEAFKSLLNPDIGIKEFTNGSIMKTEDSSKPGSKKTSEANISVARLNHVVSSLNSRIDYGSRYLIFQYMNAPKRAQWCAALQIVSGLASRGIELPCLDVLLEAGSTIVENDGERTSLKTNDLLAGEKHGSMTGATQNTSSSIFDSFDRPTPKAKSVAQSSASSGQMSSSIFDNFEQPRPPPKKPTATNNVASGGMSSSIFDDFDTPSPPSKKTTGAAAPSPASNAGEMTSSIFDSFDGPRPQKKKVEPAASGTMSSSIFDSFDVNGPAKVKKTPAPSTGEMTSSIFDSFDGPARPPPKKAPVAAAPASGAMSSSIFDSFDAAGPVRKKAPAPAPAPSIFDSFDNMGGKPGKKSPAKEPEPLITEQIVKPMPKFWESFRVMYLTRSAARRLLREISRVCGLFYGDLPDPQMSTFRQSNAQLVPHGAAEVVQHRCDIDIVRGMKECLAGLCNLSQISTTLVLEDAMTLLNSEGSTGLVPAYSILFRVILHLIEDKANLAEAVVSEASKQQILLCEAMCVSNDDYYFKRRTKFHLSSQFLRRQACQISWQLELCLWLYRGGSLPLSSLVMKEAIAGSRVGLLVCTWARNHDTLENILKCDPDCVLDFEAGRQLWTSWKMMSSDQDTTKKKKNTKSSGGWEFLVDCKRSEATDMLKPKRTGTFLLRPHPEDHGVFTLSFKTNLVPTIEKEPPPQSKKSKKGSSPKAAKVITPDDVVQHAIIRLSDAGFRCGSFGPFGSLIKLLEAVSTSLPFDLLFDAPPSEGIIKDEGEQPSPSSFLFRKLALHSKTQRYTWHESKELAMVDCDDLAIEGKGSTDDLSDGAGRMSRSETKRCSLFMQLLAITEATRQTCAVFGAEYDEEKKSQFKDAEAPATEYEASEFDDEDDTYTLSIRTLRPLVEWRRSLEVQVLPELAPELSAILQNMASLPVAVLDASDSGIEALPSEVGSFTVVTGGDAVIRRMIQSGSGVHFHSLRVGDSGHSAIVVLFKRDEAIPWIVSSGTEKDEKDALSRLHWMEKRRVIEPVDLDELMALWNGKTLKRQEGEEPKNLRYRFIDPWEVQPLESWEAESEEIVLGRESYVPFSVLSIAQSCEPMLRAIGGIQLLSLWNTTKGGIFLTKAVATVLPPWERDVGADLSTSDGSPDEPTPLIINVRRHLYRNQIFRRLRLPQRFLALVQVEMLDLKNLTAPGGTSSTSAYCLLRLHRKGAKAPLSHKAKPLDCHTTEPKKIGKSSGPNAPASWGTVVRFRFPLPEDVDCDGVSHDIDRETLFKGPPTVLQIAVYEKKFISDVLLGTADISLDGLNCFSGLEEWVPLKGGKTGITWFSRIRISLRFELMCISSGDRHSQLSPIGPVSTVSESALKEGGDIYDKKSVGLQKIYELCRSGGAHEDAKSMKHSESTPDFFGYFDHM